MPRIGAESGLCVGGLAPPRLRPLGGGGASLKPPTQFDKQVLHKNDFRPSARKSFVSGFAAGRKSYPQGVRTKEFFFARCARACVSGPLRMHALLTPHASHHPPHTSRSTLASLGLRRVPRTMHLPMRRVHLLQLVRRHA